MNERLRSLIKNIIINDYYASPSQIEIIAKLRRYYSDEVNEIRDYDLSSFIGTVSEDIDFNFLNFKKKVHKEFFDQWTSAQLLGTSDIDQILTQATSNGIAKDLIVDAIFSFITDNEFVKEKQGVSPQEFSINELLSDNWIPRILYESNTEKKESEEGKPVKSKVKAILNAPAITEKISAGQKNDVIPTERSIAKSDEKIVVSPRKRDDVGIGNLANTNPGTTASKSGVIFMFILFLSVTSTLGYFIWLKPYLAAQEPRMYSIVDGLKLRSTPTMVVTTNVIDSFNYGDDIIVDYNTSDWVKVETNGKSGYVQSKYLMNKNDFVQLNGIFNDNESKQAVSAAKYRRVLLQYFKDHNITGKIDSTTEVQLYGSQQNRDIWQVFSKGKGIEPNSVLTTKKIVNPYSKFPDFAVIIENITNKKRKFLLFTFDDDETPHLASEQDAPDEGDIVSVKKTWNKGLLIYNVTYTSSATPGNLSFIDSKKSLITVTEVKTYTGSIGKSNVIYTIKWFSDETLDGTYYYTSRTRSIYTLKGRAMDGGRILLTEYTDGKITAHCDLKIDDVCFSGKMNNMDGRHFDMKMCEQTPVPTITQPKSFSSDANSNINFKLPLAPQLKQYLVGKTLCGIACNGSDEISAFMLDQPAVQKEQIVVRASFIVKDLDKGESENCSGDYVFLKEDGAYKFSKFIPN